MTDRERLLKILNVPIYPHENVDPLEAVADFLLDNGVTFAKDTNVPSWISVNDFVPEPHKKVLCSGPKGGIFIAETRRCAGRVLWDDRTRIGRRNVTHWMPLPEPPKGE